mgnify:CR=1 FL=1
MDNLLQSNLPEPVAERSTNPHFGSDAPLHTTSLRAAESATLGAGGITITNYNMLGFGHQTVFGLCLALIVLASVSVVCVALLFVERQDIDLMQQHVTSLREENDTLRSQLDGYRSGLVTQQEAAARSPH